VIRKEIPEGFCQCGCGEETGIAKVNDAEYGWVKGKPYKFKSGHNLRMLNVKGPKNLGWKGGSFIASNGYRLKYSPNHPDKINGGYVLEHRLIAEKALGKFLPKNSVIHHLNGNPLDNTNTNLVVCENNAYHLLLHQRTRALKQCGHADWRRCGICKQHDDPKNLMIFKNNYVVHRECNIKKLREKKRLKELQGR
jgi:hypothetical protein